MVRRAPPRLQRSHGHSKTIRCLCTVVHNSSQMICLWSLIAAQTIKRPSNSRFQDPNTTGLHRLLRIRTTTHSKHLPSNPQLRRIRQISNSIRRPNKPQPLICHSHSRSSSLQNTNSNSISRHHLWSKHRCLHQQTILPSTMLQIWMCFRQRQLIQLYLLSNNSPRAILCHSLTAICLPSNCSSPSINSQLTNKGSQQVGLAKATKTIIQIQTDDHKSDKSIKRKKNW